MTCVHLSALMSYKKGFNGTTGYRALALHASDWGLVPQALIRIIYECRARNIPTPNRTKPNQGVTPKV